MDSLVERLRGGVLGEFVAATVPLSDEREIGHLRLDDSRWTELALLSPMDGVGGPADAWQHETVAGTTEVGDVLLTGVTSWSAGHLYGVELSSALRYRTRHLLAGVDLAEVSGDLAQAAELFYQGLHGWSVGEPLTETLGGDDGVLWTAQVRAASPIETPLGDGTTLLISRQWTLSGSADQRLVTVPVAIGVHATERRPLGELLTRLDAAHALLSLAHEHDVKAISGRARLTFDGGWAELWDALMIDDHGDRPRWKPGLFGLDDLGGAEGVGRWVTLCLEHRRAVSPIVNHRQVGGQAPESRLLAICAAMQYWVSSQARAHRWAKGVEGYDVPVALAGHVSGEFRGWAGDPEKWADRLWAYNNKLKHDPAADLDVQDVSYLELSARWLLTAVLLDSCAGGTAPSQRIFGKSLWRLGQGMRRHFGWDPTTL